MKMKLLLAAVGLLSLAACSNSNDWDGETVPVSITAGLSSNHTRAVNQNWNGDVIGVTVIDDTQKSMTTAEYTNVPYSTTSTDTKATFKSVNYSILFRANYTGTATFAAYAPYSADVSTGNTLPLNTAENNDTPANQEAYLDYIFATGATASFGNPVVAFEGDYSFTHQLVQLNLTFKTVKTDDLTYDISQLSALKLSGIIHEGSFNILTGEVLATGDVVDDWDILNTNYTDDAETLSRTYSLIVLPQTLKSALKLAVTIQGKTYVSNAIQPDMTKNGIAYNYEISIRGNKGIVIEGSTITNWIPQDTTTDNAYQE
jgi:hypothetical protein